MKNDKCKMAPSASWGIWNRARTNTSFKICRVTTSRHSDEIDDFYLIEGFACIIIRGTQCLGDMMHAKPSMR